MKHSAAHDEIIERSALFALGTLSQEEARAFEEHLAEGCEVCRAEVDAFVAVVAKIGEGAAEQEPPPRVRADLLKRIAGENGPGIGTNPALQGSSQILSVARDQGEWLQVREGILVKPLYVDKSSGISTSLVRMLPGTHLPRHRHNGVEQFLVLEGDCHVHGEVLGPGDFHRAEAGSIHETTYTENGTMFLLIAPPNYDVLEG